jgi:hypothetical protein
MLLQVSFLAHKILITPFYSVALEKQVHNDSCNNKKERERERERERLLM